MEPIGTITKFYPFLTEDIRETVESILSEAESYDDFVSKLVDTVLAQDVTNDLLQFAAIQSWISGNRDIGLRLQPLLIEHVVLKPWSIQYVESFEVSEEFLRGFPISFTRALEALPGNWVNIHLLMLGTLHYHPRHERQRILDEAKNLLEKHPELRCFSPEIHSLQGWFLIEANFDEAVDHFRQAMQLAEDYNDVIRKAAAQRDFANFTKGKDTVQALSHMEESYQTFTRLGAKSGAHTTARHMGLLHIIIGEYDLAVEFYAKAIELSEPRGWVRYAISVAHSHMYCDIDLPEQALEWIKWIMDGEEISGPVLERITAHYSPFFPLAVARTLIQLGQLDGVSELLRAAHRLVLKIGREVDLLLYNFVSGLFDIATGNQDTGFQTMVDALNEAERLNIQADVVSINSILLSLAKAELMTFSASEGDRNIESSGPWMTRLGIYARENNYPGIMMQHALLKAEYQNQIGETEAAILTLQDALTFTDSLGVKTLRNRIQERLQDLETSVDV